MRHAHVLGLGAVDQVTEDPASASPAMAVHGLATIGAAAAGGDAGDQDPVPRPYGAHVGAGLHHLADRLVPEHRAGTHLGYVALEDVQVGAADGDGVDAHDHVGGVLETGVRDVLPGEVSGTMEDEALHDDPSHQLPPPGPSPVVAGQRLRGSAENTVARIAP